MLNRAEYSIDPWGTTLVTSFQLDFTELTAILCGPSVRHILWLTSLFARPAHTAAASPGGCHRRHCTY